MSVPCPCFLFLYALYSALCSALAALYAPRRRSNSIAEGASGAVATVLAEEQLVSCCNLADIMGPSRGRRALQTLVRAAEHNGSHGNGDAANALMLSFVLPQLGRQVGCLSAFSMLSGKNVFHGLF